MKVLNINVNENEKEIKKVIRNFKSNKINKSEAIRNLFLLGLSVKEISKELDIIYNMCYNITKKLIIRNDLSIEKEKKVSIETKIRETYATINEELGFVKKSELIRRLVKEKHGESYVYTKLKSMKDLEFTK